MTLLSDLIYYSAAEGLDVEMHPDVDTVNLMPAGTGALLTIAGGENGPRCRETGHQDYHDATELHGATLLEVAEQTTLEMSGAPATLDLAIDAFAPITEWDTFNGEVIIDHRPHMLKELARHLPGCGDSMRLAELSFDRAARFFRWRSPKYRSGLDPAWGGMELAGARRHLNDAFFHCAAAGPYVIHINEVTKPMTPEEVRALDMTERQRHWDALASIAKDVSRRRTEEWRARKAGAAA